MTAGNVPGLAELAAACISTVVETKVDFGPRKPVLFQAEKLPSESHTLVSLN